MEQISGNAYYDYCGGRMEFQVTSEGQGHHMADILINGLKPKNRTEWFPKSSAATNATSLMAAGKSPTMTGHG